MTTADQIAIICDEIKRMLIEKNATYGDSAINPLRIFSNADAVEQIKVRIDDKLSRLQRGSEYQGDDTVTDLIGYLILYKVALCNQQTPKDIIEKILREEAPGKEYCDVPPPTSKGAINPVGLRWEHETRDIPADWRRE